MIICFGGYHCESISTRAIHSGTPTVLDDLIIVYSLLQSPLQSSINLCLQRNIDHHWEIFGGPLGGRGVLYDTVDKKGYMWKVLPPFIQNRSSVINISTTVVVSISRVEKYQRRIFIIYFSGQLCVVYCGGGRVVDRRVAPSRRIQ